VSESTESNEIAKALAHVKTKITQATQSANRSASSVQLLAVSKRKPLNAIEAAWLAGQRDFGENYVDEPLDKIFAWQATHNNSGVRWHFIGALQSRNAAKISAHVDWVHSVDRVKVANKLAMHRPASAGQLSVCIQVNLDNESSKSGARVADVPELAAHIETMSALKLRGLMSIPAPRSDFEEQCAVFRRLAALQASLRTTYPDLDTLSMGMSGDLDAAVAEGATIVRVGTAIFGAREA